MAGRMRSVRFPLSLGLTLGTMASAHVLLQRVVPQADLAVGAGMVGGLTAVAVASDMTVDDVGLAKRRWGSGLRWGAAAAAIVAAGYGIAALIPAVREITPASTMSWQSTVLQAAVVIPLATVIPEEFAFRGVLFGLLQRQSGRRVATAVSSALFGLWHVLPALGGGAANASAVGVVGDSTAGVVLRVVGTVLFTGLGGVVLCELRSRSGSLLAPMGLHWAINGFGELFVLAV